MPDERSAIIVIAIIATIIAAVTIRRQGDRITDLEHDLKWSRERADYLATKCAATSTPTKPQPDCDQLNQALSQNMAALNHANAKAAHAEQRYEQMLRFWHAGYAGMVIVTREGAPILTRCSLN